MHSLFIFIFIGGTAVLPMGVAPEAAGKRSRLLAISFFPRHLWSGFAACLPTLRAPGD